MGDKETFLVGNELWAVGKLFGGEKEWAEIGILETDVNFILAIDSSLSGFAMLSE